MQKLNLFSTPVAIFDLPDFERINKIILDGNLKGVAEQNGSDTFEYSQDRNIWSHRYNEGINILHDFFLESAAKYATEFFEMEYKPDFFRHARGWINFCKYGQEYRFHSHRMTTIAATYYVDVGDKGGIIRLLDPRSTLGWISLNPEHYNVFNYKPKAGQMIMFPGWLVHQVSHNQTDKDRVAVTTNMNLIQKHYATLV